MKNKSLIVLTFIVFFSFTDVYADTLCKRATTLHTNICGENDSICQSVGYTLDGDMGTTTVTYGSLGYGKLVSGNAFDCDVNGDGIYDAVTERFYYVTDLDEETAVLIFYNNVLNGMITDNSNGGSYGINYNGPVYAIKHLPTTSYWKNTSLKQTIRAIVSEKNENFVNIRTDVHYLPTNFSYNGYAARLLTYQEIEKACTLDKSGYSPKLKDCFYLLENINFAAGTQYSFFNTGYFLENPASYSYNSHNAIVVHHDLTVSSSNGGYNYAVRPAIEVSKDRIEGSKDIDTEIKTSNSNISLSGKISELYKKELKVKEFSKDSEEYKKILNMFKDKKNVIAYNFNLYDSNNKIVEPESKVTVNIKLPKNINYDKLKVWYILDDFNKQELSYSIKEDILSFETDHFSIYALTEDIEGEVVQVADTAFSITKLGVSIGLVILVLGVMVIVQTLLKDKQKNQ